MIYITTWPGETDQSPYYKNLYEAQRTYKQKYCRSVINSNKPSSNHFSHYITKQPFEISKTYIYMCKYVCSKQRFYRT